MPRAAVAAEHTCYGQAQQFACIGIEVVNEGQADDITKLGSVQVTKYTGIEGCIATLYSE